jgi:hypothetical protein
MPHDLMAHVICANGEPVGVIVAAADDIAEAEAKKEAMARAEYEAMRASRPNTPLTKDFTTYRRRVSWSVNSVAVVLPGGEA